MAISETLPITDPGLSAGVSKVASSEEGPLPPIRSSSSNL